jgi:hypothetical protein
MNTSSTKRTALFGASILTAVLAAGCGEVADRPEIKQCLDAGGIAIRSIWDPTMLSECIFPPDDKAANA